MRYTSVALALLTLAFTACGTVDRRIDPDDPDPVGGAVLQSQDIRTMADEMARSITAQGVLASVDPGKPITFYITELRNDTSDTIDKEIVLTKLRTNLFKALNGRVAILDRSSEGLAAVKAEREAKRAGAVSADPSRTGDVLGADFVLKGTIKERRAQASDLKSVYYLVTFELTDLETTRLVWTDDYETKFESEKSVITR